MGCPSSRVKAGRFGACLMHEPERVAECVRAMREAAAGRPVTVKTRIGTNHRPGFRHLLEFARTMRDAGVAALAVHARIAVLEGLSPKENRNVPPLRYGTVYRLKDALPDLPVVINGGIAGAAEICAHLQRVDGVMLGARGLRQPLASDRIARFGTARARACALAAKAFAAHPGGGAAVHGRVRPTRRPARRAAGRHYPPHGRPLRRTTRRCRLAPRPGPPRLRSRKRSARPAGLRARPPAPRRPDRKRPALGKGETPSLRRGGRDDLPPRGAPVSGVSRGRRLRGRVRSEVPQARGCRSGPGTRRCCASPHASLPYPHRGVRRWPPERYRAP